MLANGDDRRENNQRAHGSGRIATYNANRSSALWAIASGEVSLCEELIDSHRQP